jgi:hypothetical protein
MKTMAALVRLLSAFLAMGCAASSEPARQEGLVYRGASDTSAAVALNRDLILVADDESDSLRVYPTRGGLPVSSYDLTAVLDVEPEHPEADIEGATAVGDRVYWITSHGRDRNGELRPSRYRFFATDVNVEDGNVLIEPSGQPCTMLAQAMVAAPTMSGLGLAEATQLDAEGLDEPDLAELAPKNEGLNIEGLAAAADGSELFIGLRNPRPIDEATGRARAIVARLENAAAVIEGHEAPVFAEPMLWDLDGMGVRSIEYSEQHGEYFIIAGRAGEGPGFALYRWSGGADDPPILARRLDQDGLRPEALVPFKGESELLLLSDDGTIPVQVSSPTECMKYTPTKDGSCLNKFLLDPEMKTFRGAWIEP